MSVYPAFICPVVALRSTTQKKKKKRQKKFAEKLSFHIFLKRRQQKALCIFFNLRSLYVYFNALLMFMDSMRVLFLVLFSHHTHHCEFNMSICMDAEKTLLQSGQFCVSPRQSRAAAVHRIKDRQLQEEEEVRQVPENQCDGSSTLSEWGIRCGMTPQPYLVGEESQICLFGVCLLMT